MTLSRNIVYYGSDTPVPVPITLRAGPLSLGFVAGEIRRVRIGGREILRRVYVAVRDRNWRTLPSTMLEARKTVDQESFALHFEVESKKDEIDFCWRGSVIGRENGTIVFKMEGRARSTFWQNRIGFCVLHPSADWAGSPCSVKTVKGDRVDGEFPLLVSPERVFTGICGISHEVFPGVQAEVLLEGGPYEMEDERNWSDASFKTYCPPLSVPFPSQVCAGRTFSQGVTLSIKGDTTSLREDADYGPAAIRLGEKRFLPPRIGLGISSGRESLSARCIDRLRALRLSHLRADLILSHDGFESQLQRAVDEASCLGIVLEVALFLTADAHAEITKLRAALDRIRPQVGTWLVFHSSEAASTQKWVDMARSGLSDYNPAALFGGGSDSYFAELNRSRPPAFGIDVVSYSLNPQVHVSDHESLIENLRAQGAMVESARHFTHGARLAITPITLRPRSNPDATCVEREVADGELPRQVDPRQMSLLGAVWTLGTLRNLVEAEIFSTTFYETVGWAGVMEVEEGPHLPAKFPSLPGSVFPVYHLFADVAEFRGGEAVLCSSSNPLKVQALAFRKDGALRIILANVTAETQTVQLVPGAHTGAFQVKLLDAQSAEFAMSSPEAFRAAAGERIAIGEEGTEVELPPLAMMRLDCV
jgi:hypothetical protein